MPGGVGSTDIEVIFRRVGLQRGPYDLSVNIRPLPPGVVERLEQHLHAALFVGAVELRIAHVVTNQQAASKAFEFKGDEALARPIVLEIPRGAKALVVAPLALTRCRNVKQRVAHIAGRDAVVGAVYQRDAQFSGQPPQFIVGSL